MSLLPTIIILLHFVSIESLFVLTDDNAWSCDFRDGKCDFLSDPDEMDSHWRRVRTEAQGRKPYLVRYYGSSSESSSARIVSPVITVPEQGACLTLDYTSHPYKGELIISTENDYEHYVHFRKTYPAPKGWTQLQLDIDRSGDTKVEINASVGRVALDNIVVTCGTCGGDRCASSRHKSEGKSGGRSGGSEGQDATTGSNAQDPTENPQQQLTTISPNPTTALQENHECVQEVIWHCNFTRRVRDPYCSMRLVPSNVQARGGAHWRGIPRQVSRTEPRNYALALIRPRRGKSNIAKAITANIHVATPSCLTFEIKHSAVGDFTIYRDDSGTLTEVYSKTAESTQWHGESVDMASSNSPVKLVFKATYQVVRGNIWQVYLDNIVLTKCACQ